MKWITGLSAMLLLTAIVSSAAAAEKTASVVGSSEKVRATRVDSTLLLHVEDTAEAFGWEPKNVTPGKLLVLCKGGDDGLCVPVQIEQRTTRKTSQGLFVEADALAEALRFEIVKTGEAVTLRPRRNASDDDPDLPAYHADWGPGRGFRVGQTVPDIPLYDLNGNEVRFSRFLGQQYIIYCWASW